MPLARNHSENVLSEARAAKSGVSKTPPWAVTASRRPLTFPPGAANKTPSPPDAYDFLIREFLDSAGILARDKAAERSHTVYMASDDTLFRANRPNDCYQEFVSGSEEVCFSLGYRRHLRQHSPLSGRRWTPRPYKVFREDPLHRVTSTWTLGSAVRGTTAPEMGAPLTVMPFSDPR